MFSTAFYKDSGKLREVKLFHIEIIFVEVVAGEKINTVFVASIQFFSLLQRLDKSPFETNKLRRKVLYLRANRLKTYNNSLVFL